MSKYDPSFWEISFDPEVLESLASMEAYRAQILFGLLQVPLTPRVEALLRDFIAEGRKQYWQRGRCVGIGW